MATSSSGHVFQCSRGPTPARSRSAARFRRASLRRFARAAGAIISRREMPESRWRRALVLLFPALFPPLQLFLFGPHVLYTGNLQEFSAPFWAIVLHLVPAVAAIAAALILLGVALPARMFRYYVTFLVAVGIVLWVQGNLIVGDYGVLNGAGIDWSGHAWRNRHELLLWLGVPALLTFFAPKLFTTAVFASRVLVA